MQTLRKQYSAACQQIADGDVLLFRRPPGSIVSRAISVSGRSDYTHAALAGWWRGQQTEDAVLCCCEVREWVGGRVVTLASQVKKFPGLIDVYRPVRFTWKKYQAQCAVKFMLSFAGRPYGWWAILRAARAYLPFVRWCHTTNTTDSWTSGAPVFCSEAVSRAMRLGGGIDPVPNLADCETEPGDLARSEALLYAFTLEADA